MDTTVVRETGKVIKVKNLGWLLKHRKEVRYFEIVDPSITQCGDCAMIAHLSGGGTYTTPWASRSVLRDWVHRPVFKGMRMVWFGRETIT